MNGLVREVLGIFIGFAGLMTLGAALWMLVALPGVLLLVGVALLVAGIGLALPRDDG